MNSAFLIVAFFICLALSFVFSLCETALTSLNVVKLRTFILETKKNLKREKLILKIIKNYSQTIATIVAFDNLMAILMSSIATALTFAYNLNAVDTTIVLVLSTIAIILFGEIIPKSIARINSVFFSYHLSLLIAFLSYLLWPFSHSWNKKKKSTNKSVYSEEELSYLVNLIEKEGIFDYHEKELVISALKFDDKKAKDILIPFKDVIYIKNSDSVKNIWKVFRESRHARLVVVDKTNVVIGTLAFKDFVYEWEENNFSKTLNLKNLINPATNVLSSFNLKEVLETFHKELTQICIVYNSYKDDFPIGIITMKDILEELVGTVNEEDTKKRRIIKFSHSRYRVSYGATAVSLFKKIYNETESKDIEFLTNSDMSFNQWVKLYCQHHNLNSDQFTFKNLEIKKDVYQNTKFFEVRILY